MNAENAKAAAATHRPQSLDLARAVAEAVRDAGGRALVVGGYVRDRLIGDPDAAAACRATRRARARRKRR